MAIVSKRTASGEYVDIKTHINGVSFDATNWDRN